MSGRLDYRKILRFPNLERTEYEVTSEETVDYNCFAFAAGEEECRWDPVDPDGYWPDGVSRELTLDAFIQAYQTIGYESCENRDLEPGFQKIAIYTYNGQPQHAARQEEDGKWKSKLGDWEDIEHELEGLENPNYYGVVQQILKRAIILLNIS
jgi:hypothetical protein